MNDHSPRNPTDVLILGVRHLERSTPDAALARGLAHLRRWNPDLIAIESLPGHLVVEYASRGGPFHDFPVGGAPTARELAESAAHLRDWDVWTARSVARDESADPTDRVIGWLLAREPLNALLLPWQTADLPAALLAELSAVCELPTERVRIGVRLALDLGHRELAHIDDHAGLAITERLTSTWMDILEQSDASGELRDSGPPPVQEPADEWDEWMRMAGPSFLSWIEDLESGSLARSHVETFIHRARLAQWRARNLAMAARLREATGSCPGGRVLVIVGSAHVPPLRAALATDQHDLRIVDLRELDGESGLTAPR